MIGNYKLQPNYGIEADKSTTGNSNMNHHFNNDYQENENTSVNFEPDRCVIATIHNYSQPISKQHHRVITRDYSSDEDEENVEDDEEEDIAREHQQDDDKEVKSIVNNTIIQEDTPEHHTRRPMNAFLMFCKRHRSIVREKFPNLENRAITKILGDWWANIDEGEKVAYTNLAKEYKDAFFSAHPNFKWYKLPAPPLRTLSTRPSSLDRASTSISEDDHDYLESRIGNYKCTRVTQGSNYEELEEYEEEADNTYNDEMDIKSENDECTKLINNNLNSIEHNLSLNNISILNMNECGNNAIKEKILIDCKKITSSSNTTPVTLFKLADIKQMGGLNSLMQTDSQNGTREAAATQNEMGDSNEALLNYCEPFTNMRDHANKMHEDSKISKTNISNNLKRKMNSTTTSSSISPPPHNMFAQIAESNDSPPKLKKNLAFVLNNNNNDFAVNNNNHNTGKETVNNDPVGKKSPRACKGQRYKEFMLNSGKFPNTPNSHLNHINSSGNTKRNKINKSGVNGSSPMLIHTGGVTSQYSDGSYLDSDAMYDANSMNNKHFATEEFDLEKRIKALPSLNLDLFMVRKREIKKKKKLSKRGKSSKTQHLKATTNETQGRTAHYYNNKVGSQKRKARKESITRLDVIKSENSDNNQPHISPSQITSQVGLVSNNNDNIDIINEPAVANQSSTTAPSNLFILATLAEEEANKTKMQIT